MDEGDYRVDAEWVRRSIERSRSIAVRGDVSLRVTARVEKNFHMIARIGNFHIIADEIGPEGANYVPVGPPPFSIFLAGVAL